MTKVETVTEAEIGRTKQGYVMNKRLRARIITVMSGPEGIISHREVAANLGISMRTLRDYLTPEVCDEIAIVKKGVVGQRIEDVDRAMMAQAVSGNVAAARLVYMRIAQRGQIGPLPTLEEMEEELRRLKKLEAHG